MAKKEVINEVVEEIKESIKSNPVKKELQKYLKTTLQIIEEISSQQFDPKKEQELKENVKTIENAEEIIAVGNCANNQNIMDVMSAMFNLVDEFKKKYNVQVDQFNESAEKYEAVKNAIKIEEKRLSELFGIEKELLNLAVVEKTQKERQSSLLNQYKEKEEELKAKYELLNQEVKFSLEKAKKNYKEMVTDLEKERQRDEEQYKYDIQLAHKKEENELREKLEKLEKEANKNLEIKKEAMEKWQEELSEKETQMEEKEEYISKLESQVQEIPELIKKAEEEASEATEKRQAQAFTYERTILKNSYQSKIELLESQLEAEKSKVDDLKKEIETVKEERKDAILKVSDMANNITEAQNAKKSQEYTENLLREIAKKDSGK